MLRLCSLCMVLVCGQCLVAQDQDFRFSDVSEHSGLLPQAAGLMGHGAGWGDVNGDGWPDLYLATFHYQASRENLLMLNHDGQFRIAVDSATAISTRGTGVLFADLDNDGDLDLYLGSMPGPTGSRLAERHGHAFAGCSLFENDGRGQFADRSSGSGACPQDFGGRSVTILDIDGDTLPDLLVGEDPIPGYSGSSTQRSRLFRNLGRLTFLDITEDVGIPSDAAGLGVAAADLNQDGWPDFVITSTLGTRVLINDGTGFFSEAAEAREVLAWPDAGGDDMICGICIADVNNDGLPDLLLGQHYSSPWVQPVACRLYLHRGLRNGMPAFQDITEAAGLPKLPLKGPHVEVQDFDNDGLPDISISMVKFAQGEAFPVLLRNLGNTNGIPQFRCTALTVNDFPTAEDRSIHRSGTFFEKMVAEHKVTYSAPGPSCDFDRDGRLDLFLPSWWPELPSLLLRNTTEGGHWLQVEIESRGQINRRGIGCQVALYRSGKAGQPDGRLITREMATGFGYASGQEPRLHFGLGDLTEVDVVITLPHGHGTIVHPAVSANQSLRIAVE